MNARPAWVEVSLSNIKHNISEIRRLAGGDRQVMAVVKANGYGHGSVEVSKAALSAGADRLAVSMLSEAIVLRQGGITCPILILGWTPERAYEQLIREDITTAIYNVAEAEALSKTALQLGKKAKVHIKVDTGMSRIGLYPDEAGVAEAQAILSLPGLEAEGIFSHFSKADELDKTYAQKQFATFMRFIHKIEECCGYHFPIRHIANSAAIIDLPETHLDMVRAGIIIYGLYPSDEVVKNHINLRPTMTWQAEVSRVQTLPADTLVGYGGTYRTIASTKVATVPVGYADGYDRHLSNSGYVAFKGHRLPVIGKVCMDQFMVDATGVDIAVGDQVTLIGQNGDAEVTWEEMAQQLGTITYELVCKVAARVPRIYDLEI